MSEGIVTLIDEAEARRCVEAINHGLDGVRAAVLDLYEREGWRALGYPSWRACVVAEFGQSERHLYRLLNAAQVERDICPMDGEYVTAVLGEAYARVLVRVLAAVREARDLMENWTPEQVARVARPATDYTSVAVMRLLRFIEAVDAAQRAPRESG